MGSVGNQQNPWQTYDSYKDCSQGICSIYCPQWCYILFPPPPPFSFSDDDGGSGPDFSPLIIAVIGILASAFLLVTYYTVISKYCRRRRSSASPDWANESWPAAAAATASSGGLDESVIKSITVWKYKRSENSADGGDCSVCLTEFQENESVRLLPKCNHKFHLPCIDTWLRSNASCPLCRANILPPETPPPAGLDAGAPAVSAQEYQYCGTSDSIIVVRDPESATENVTARNEAIRDGTRPMRRSASLNLYNSNGNLLSIADILSINDDDDEGEEIRGMEVKKVGIMKLIRSPLALKRSISTGRFMFLSSSYENHMNSLFPN